MQEALEERGEREVSTGHCDSDSLSTADNIASPTEGCGSCGDDRNTPRSGSDSVSVSILLAEEQSGATLTMEEEEEEEELQCGKDCPDRLEDMEGEQLRGKNLSHNRKERER